MSEKDDKVRLTVYLPKAQMDVISKAIEQNEFNISLSAQVEFAINYWRQNSKYGVKADEALKGKESE